MRRKLRLQFGMQLNRALHYFLLIYYTPSESKWSKASSGLKITPIVTAKEAFSVGDAMRDIYTHGIITTDFVLVMGDLVSNIRIDEVVRIHKERRKVNKDAIMTMIVKEAGTSHRTRYVLPILVILCNLLTLVSLMIIGL